MAAYSVSKSSQAIQTAPNTPSPPPLAMGVDEKAADEGEGIKRGCGLGMLGIAWDLCLRPGTRMIANISQSGSEALLKQPIAQ